MQDRIKKSMTSAMAPLFHEEISVRSILDLSGLAGIDWAPRIEGINISGMGIWQECLWKSKKSYSGLGLLVP